MATAKQRQRIGLLDDTDLVGAINDGMAASAPQAISARIDARRSEALARAEADVALLRSARPHDTITQRDDRIEVVTGPIEKRWLFTFVREGYGYRCWASRIGVLVAETWLRDTDIVRVARVVKAFAQNHHGELVASGEVDP